MYKGTLFFMAEDEALVKGTGARLLGTREGIKTHGANTMMYKQDCEVDDNVMHKLDSLWGRITGSLNKA